MKFFILLLIAATALSQNIVADYDVCIVKTKLIYSELTEALTQNSMDSSIDSLQKVSEKIPGLLRACGADSQAQKYEQQYPAACTKLLAKQAKIFIKIMKLYAEDQQKNEKQILIYSAMFQTIYKTQVQKKCPFLAQQHLMQTKNKGECAEGAYRLSLVFEQLDNDLAAGKFNSSLNDMGKVVEQLPVALDHCGQTNLAALVRSNFPDECLKAIGGLVRETVTFEKNYTHYEWLHKHFKDYLRAVNQVKVTCPALQH